MVRRAVGFLAVDEYGFSQFETKRDNALLSPFAVQGH
jgi:hypothetical protein